MQWAKRRDASTPIDDLTYEYRGNKLYGVDDTISDTTGMHFADFGSKYSEGQEYYYDANGNMISDANKGITEITYNAMNLPETITWSDGRQIKWQYTAGGSKLKKEVYDGTAKVFTQHYVGGYVYRDSTLEFFAFDEGRVRNHNGHLRYEYDLKDHLGNVRATFASEDGLPKLLQRDDYYPFGLKFNSSTTGPENKFTYNGKELEDEHGLNWYHYGARFYDPAVARWWATDPADVEHGPYNYSFNSPINFVDPDGTVPLDWIQNKETGNYIYDPNVTSADNTPDGFKYIGSSLSDVRSHFINSLSMLNPAKYFPSLSGLTGTTANIDFSNYRGSITNHSPVTTLGNLKEGIDQSPAPVRIPSNILFETIDAINISLLQGTTRTRISLTGEVVSGSAITDAGVKSLTTLMSSPFLKISRLAGVNGLNAAQFSQKFKGTVISRSAPKLRGILNRLYNFGHTRQVEYYTKGVSSSSVYINSK